VGNEIRLSLLV